MSLVTSTIRFTKNSDKVIYATSALLNKLNMTPKQNLTLGLGLSEMKVTLKRIKKPGIGLYIPASVRSLLRIPRGGKCFIFKEKDDSLRIGPLIGILTGNHERTAGRPFGPKTLSLKSYLLAGAGRAFYFAFSPKDVNWQQRTVDGYFYSSKSGWSKQVVSLPDVIYNRITNRTTERSSAQQAFKNRVVQYGIPIFNWSFFDKWEVYHLLEGDKEASAHVPESYIDPSSDQIKDMLEKHKFIYLKPTSGYLGIGIYRLTKHPKRGYFVRYRKNGSNVLLRFSKFQSLVKQMNRQNGSRMKNYVAQQGIRLIELDQCPLDFRFHLNKNKDNKWVVAGIGAKKAGRGSVTTHVRSGGKLMTPEYALSKIYGTAEAEKILENAKKATIRLANAIEKNYSHRIGELGFDIGIDKKGNIWMFEANAKPGRSIFKHPELKEEGRQSYRYIFEHCLYLSGFLSSSGGED